MFKKCLALILIVLVSGFVGFGLVIAQDELPIAEENFPIAETLLYYCFGGADNYYSVLFSEEDSSSILADHLGLDEASAAIFSSALYYLNDLATVGEESGETVSAVTAKSYFYDFVLESCYGQEIVPAVTEAEDIGYFVNYFELDEETTAYFYYIYEEYAYYYESVEVYLIENGVEPDEVDYALYHLEDEEAITEYFEEIDVEIDSEEFNTELEELEADAEDTYTEDEGYVEDEGSDDGSQDDSGD